MDILYWFAIPILLNFVIAQYTPVFRLRYVLFTSFGFYIQIIYCLNHLKHAPFVKWTLSIILAFLFVNDYSPGIKQIENWNNVISIVRKEKTKKTAVFLSANYKYMDFSYYYDKDIFRRRDKAVQLLKKQNIYPINDSKELNDVQKLDEFSKILLILSHNSVVDPENTLSNYFYDSESWTYCDKYGSNIEAKVVKFIKPDQICLNTTTISSQQQVINCATWNVTEYIVNSMDKKMLEYSLQINEPTNCKKKNNLEPLGLKIGTGNSYSPSLRIPISNLQKIEIQAIINLTNPTNAKFILAIENESELLKYDEYYINDVVLPSDNQLKNVQFSANVEGYYKKTEISVYIWNPEGGDIHLQSYNLRCFNK